jgi:NAD+ synthase (glutamine-hydrolysing)
MTADVSSLPRIALVQMEVHAARPDLNVARMKQHIDAARERGAEVIVFSELCLSGYIIGDLWEVDSLVRDFAAYSDEICAASEGVTVLFGNVAVDEDDSANAEDGSAIAEDGRLRKYNAVFVCHDGQYVSRDAGVPAGPPTYIQPKTLHPNYRFFDDDRHFYSVRKLAQAVGASVYDWCVPFEVERDDGSVFRFGVQLCEDIWSQDYEYEGDMLNTFRVYGERGAQAVFNLSASPWTWQKNDKRNRVVRDILKRSPLPLFYVNQVGAQNNGKNIIVFDGDSTVYAHDGTILQRSEPWREQILFSADAAEEEAGDPRQTETEAVYDAVLSGLRHLDQLRDGGSRFLVGLSGGIDSGVVACLLVKAFGPERVFGVNMPTRFNAQITRDNARLICERLGIDYQVCAIEELYGQVADQIRQVEFPRSKGSYDRLVDENIQARIRFSDILAGIAAKHGFLFTNNGNKTELALGYTTLYGDLGGAIAPIADLYKTQVYQLGRFLNERVFGAQVIPQNLLTRETVPSAELSEAQDVTKGLGDPIKYDYHDAVLRQLIEYRHHPSDLLQWFKDGELLERLGLEDNRAVFEEYFPDVAGWIADLEWVQRQLRVSFFKRIQSPPLIVLSKRAFGFDLRETQYTDYQPREYERLKRELLQQEKEG